MGGNNSAGGVGSNQKVNYYYDTAKVEPQKWNNFGPRKVSMERQGDVAVGGIMPRHLTELKSVGNVLNIQVRKAKEGNLNLGEMKQLNAQLTHFKDLDQKSRSLSQKIYHFFDNLFGRGRDSVYKQGLEVVSDKNLKSMEVGISNYRKKLENLKIEVSTVEKYRPTSPEEDQTPQEKYKTNEIDKMTGAIRKQIEYIDKNLETMTPKRADEVFDNLINLIRDAHNLEKGIIAVEPEPEPQDRWY